MIWLNGYEVEFKIFPNGETKLCEDQINDIIKGEGNKVDFTYHSDSDLIKLMFLKKYLDSKNQIVVLNIGYMPYSRMDRSEDGSAFTLKYVADFINSLYFDGVAIFEPHSDVTPALVNDAEVVYLTEQLIDHLIDDIGFDINSDYLFFPDATAQKRYGKMKPYKQLAGFKKRNFQTGKIEDIQIVGDQDINGRKVIIWDDLCSYGGTFIQSAKKLKDIGAGNIYLLVGHCEESIYKGDLLSSGLIDLVYTTNTLIKESQDKKIKLFEWRYF